MPTQPVSPTPPPHENWFIIRTFSIDASREPEDTGAGNILLDAITRGFDLAKDQRYRQVMVTDQNGMCWAIFNQLWQGL